MRVIRVLLRGDRIRLVKASLGMQMFRDFKWRKSPLEEKIK